MMIVMIGMMISMMRRRKGEGEDKGLITVAV